MKRTRNDATRFINSRRSAFSSSMCCRVIVQEFQHHRLACAKGGCGTVVNLPSQFCGVLGPLDECLTVAFHDMTVRLGNLVVGIEILLFHSDDRAIRRCFYMPEVLDYSHLPAKDLVI